MTNSSLTIAPVRTRREQRQFIELPWQLNRDDPHWIPPLRMNVKELVGFSKHPFHEVNQVQAFLAQRNGEVVGRIVGIVNQAHIERYQDRRGFFGFFESVDDQEVANGLFGAVQSWLAERQIQDIRGPTNPSMNYEC